MQDRFFRWREALALRMAPWLYRAPDLDDALSTLSALAYGSPDAVWTSHRVLVRTALEVAASNARRAQ
jgi:hypothetical protein